MRGLFPLLDGFRAIMDDVDANEGEMTPAHEEALAALELDAAALAEQWLMWRRERESLAATLAATAKQMAERAARLAKQTKRADEALDQLLTITGHRKIETPLATFWRQKKPASLVLDVPEDEVPEMWIKVKTETSVDRVGIKKAIQANDPEAKAIGHLKQDEYVRVKYS